MNETFADAFFYIAILNSFDSHHSSAVNLRRSLRSKLVTSHWTLMEVADALSSPRMRPHTHRFLVETAADPEVLIIGPDSEWYDRGLSLYGSRPDKSWSLTDCISFEIMTARGITEALTGDQHFIQAGFRALLLPDLEP